MIGVYSALSLRLSAQELDSNVSINTKAQVVQTRVIGDHKRLIRRYDDEVFKRAGADKVIADLTLDANTYGFIAHEIAQSSSGDTIIVSIQLGQAHQWNDLSASEEAEEVFRKSGVNLRRNKRRPVSPWRINRMMEKGVRYLENHGFPFAAFRLDSIVIDEGMLSANIEVDYGPLITIDSVRINGDLKLREAYLTNYLGIREGSIYNESKVLEIQERIEDIAFITTLQDPQIVFSEDKATINLYLNTRKASRFDGLIGFLPDDVTGKVLITGDARLHLENALKQGEVIDANWRKLQTNTQELNLTVVSPFVLNTPVTLDGQLKIYRRDTLFTDVFRQAGLRYVFGSSDYLRFFVDRQTTDLISTKQYESSVVVPPYLDRAITSYGGGVQWLNTDYRINPSKGFEIRFQAAVGNKEIIVNQSLPSVIYDSLKLKTLQFRIDADLGYYFKIVPRVIWHQRTISATLINDQLFNNEAFRIGGLKSLRGVDEESIYATAYSIWKNELRYQFDQEGYVFGFFDGAWYENTSLNAIGAKRDTPYGFGAGITFGTKAGVFSLSYALGSQLGNPVQLRANKIHFGFLSVF